MRKLIAICTVLVTGSFTSAGATEIWEACNSCSDRQVNRAAMRAIPANTAGQFDVYIMDFAREVVQKYEVRTFYDSRERSYLTAAWAVTTEAHIAYEFSEVVHAIKQELASFPPVTPIPEDVAPSAFDIVHSALLQQRVSDYVNEHLTFWQTIGAPAAVPLSAFGKIVDLNFIVSVSFSDGSTANLALTGLEGAITEIRYAFEFVAGSARDADGNLIPSDASDAAPYSGIFSTQAFADDMADFIVRWYSEGGALISCRSEVSSGGVTVICNRR